MEAGYQVTCGRYARVAIITIQITLLSTSIYAGKATQHNRDGNNQPVKHRSKQDQALQVWIMYDDVHATMIILYLVSRKCQLLLIPFVNHTSSKPRILSNVRSLAHPRTHSNLVIFLSAGNSKHLSGRTTLPSFDCQ